MAAEKSKFEEAVEGDAIEALDVEFDSEVLSIVDDVEVEAVCKDTYKDSSGDVADEEEIIEDVILSESSE